MVLAGVVLHCDHRNISQTIGVREARVFLQLKLTWHSTKDNSPRSIPGKVVRDKSSPQRVMVPVFVVKECWI